MPDGTRMQVERRGRGSSFAQRHVLDALVVDGHEAWGLLARDVEDLADLLDLEGDPAPLRVCRAVRGDGTLVLGTADPRRDPLLSFVVGGLDGESA